MMKFLNCRRKSRSRDAFFCSAISFLPYLARRTAASRSLNPDAELPRAWSTSVAGWSKYMAPLFLADVELPIAFKCTGLCFDGVSQVIPDNGVHRIVSGL